ncbi:MAG: hypothetical protein PHR35_09380, partial [Kiritimatiellae bacterium]|nr:hypothetical protein [Kiritimatiellia bacterium]
REHFGNLAYLTNYDPRFEEALLVVHPTGTPVLFVGNEGMGYSNIARLKVERRLCQTLSLLGQPRDSVRPLHLLLTAAGLGTCRRIGGAGWKYFAEGEVKGGDRLLDFPEYLAAALRQAAPSGAKITNETALFMDPETGLRNLHEPEQLAYFEWVATHNSESLLQGIRRLKSGITEFQAFANMPFNGTPLCCHPVVSGGDNLRRYGMASTTSRKLGRGEPLFMTLSYQGANVCRFGWVARGSGDLPRDIRDYVTRVAFPYFATLLDWYEAFRIGATGHDLHRAATGRLFAHGFALGLNAGHQIAMDEWTHSLVAAGSTAKIRSGMYWQSDFFPTLPTAHYGAFAEDGLAVADAGLRETLAAHYPRMWARVQARRRFMIRNLGYRLADEVLPFSNLAGAVIPYFLSPDRCPIRQACVTPAGKELTDA